MKALADFLKEFIHSSEETGVPSNITYDGTGLCTNIETALGKAELKKFQRCLFDLHKGMCSLYPIYDEESYLSPFEQYTTLPLYKRNQLKLRIELAKQVLELLDESF